MAEHATRGRPKGSGIDDSAQLAAIAHLIDGDPKLKPTTAIKALGITDPSVIRRLRDKYSEMREGSPAPHGTNGVGQPSPASTEGNLASALYEPTARPARPHAVAARARSAAKRTAMPAETALPPGSATAKPDHSELSESRLRLVTSKPCEAPPGEDTKTRGAESRPTLEPADGAAAKRTEAREVAPRAGGASRVPEREPSTGGENAPCALPETRTGPSLPKLSLKKPEDLFVALCGLGIAASSSALAAQVSVTQTLVRNSYVSLALRQQLALNEWALQLMPSPAAKASRRG